MEAASLILLSRQAALQQQMDVLANNIANVNTTAYKGQAVLFQTYVIEPQPGDRMDFVIDRATLRNTSTGAMARTGNDLDVALQGDGYFGVQTPQGVQYTRAGSFALNNSGDIVTQDGLIVMSLEGQALNVPDDARTIEIDQTGRIITDKGEVGKFQVVTFKREQEMVETGRGLYQTKETGQPVENTRVVQGMLEQSNVQPVVEMTRVTEVVRAYQQTLNMLQSENERMRNAIKTLGRVSYN